MLYNSLTKDATRSMIAIIYVWFLRIMAVLSLTAALIYWAQLTGISNGGKLRFDVLETHWRILKTVLSVILPAAGLGLWMTQPWGIVLWLAAMSIELAAFGIWTDLFEPRPMVVITHGAAISVLCILTVALFIEKRRMRTFGF